MPVITLGDGQGIAIKPSITYEQLRGLCFENLAAPTGVTKGTGNPPAWIEFDGSVTETGTKLSIKQSNIVTVQP